MANPRTAAQLLAAMRAGPRVDLAKHRTDETFGWDKETAKAELADGAGEWSPSCRSGCSPSGTRALLVVLQAMDAGGKDGVIRNVLTGLNPAGVQRRQLRRAERGGAGRTTTCGASTGSARAGADRGLQPQPLRGRARRARQAARAEPGGAGATATSAIRADARRRGHDVVKLFLHISKEEQRLRLQDRIDSPDERWKFRLGDLDDRALWDDYMAAYRDALRKTSTDAAPWYVVPADRKWVRNLAVAKILRHVLERLDPQYPDPSPASRVSSSPDPVRAWRRRVRRAEAR